MSILLPIAAAGVVALSALSMLVQPLRPVAATDISAAEAKRGQLSRALGARVRSRAGRSPDPDQDLLVGRLVVGLVVVAAVLPIALPLAALGALAASVMGQRRCRARLASAVARELPGFVDLYAVGVHAGLGSGAIIDVIARRVGGVVATELSEAVTLQRLGRPWSELLPAVIARLGAGSRPFLEAIEAYETSGVAIAESLLEIGQSLRDDQRRTAEAAARRLPVQMLFPLIVCVLPAFLLLTVAPIVVEAFGTLGH